MAFSRTPAYRGHRGAVLVISMIFMTIFSIFAVSLASLSNVNAQVAANHQKANRALTAAQSGLDCVKYIAKKAILEKTYFKDISPTQADQAWTDLRDYIGTLNLDGKGVTSGRLPDGTGDQIDITGLDLGNSGGQCNIHLYRYDDDPMTILLKSTGIDGQIQRTIEMQLGLVKEGFEDAIVSRGRMWLTGDTTIEGDIFSTWDRADISPFNITSDSTINGTVKTVLTQEEIDQENEFQLNSTTSSGLPLFSYGETVYDAEGDPISGTYGSVDDNGYMTDTDGNPVFDNDGNRVPVDLDNRYIGSDDELQGYYEGLDYGSVYDEELQPGIDISDYDTDSYLDGLVNIPSSSTEEVEYFPHASGDYTYPRDGSPSNTWNEELDRHVYENQTFTDARLPQGRHALFRNCTFEGVLYVDCYKNSTSRSRTNNVRFEDCQFNGVIITDVPKTFHWRRNCLYFTGEATFDNQSDVPEATILAPHFNVNLGNTNPQQSDNNILQGAIVGGIVDVRGNAKITGSIISMCDTTQWSSGYVTNIGATLNDGGSETTELGDVGVINIEFSPYGSPNGILTPITIQANLGSYSECTL